MPTNITSSWLHYPPLEVYKVTRTHALHALAAIIQFITSIHNQINVPTPSYGIPMHACVIHTHVCLNSQSSTGWWKYVLCYVIDVLSCSPLRNVDANLSRVKDSSWNINLKLSEGFLSLHTHIHHLKEVWCHGVSNTVEPLYWGHHWSRPHKVSYFGGWVSTVIYNIRVLRGVPAMDMFIFQSVLIKRFHCTTREFLQCIYVYHHYTYCVSFLKAILLCSCVGGYGHIRKKALPCWLLQLYIASYVLSRSSLGLQSALSDQTRTFQCPEIEIPCT